MINIFAQEKKKIHMLSASVSYLKSDIDVSVISSSHVCKRTDNLSFFFFFFFFFYKLLWLSSNHSVRFVPTIGLFHGSYVMQL